jgi:hypothetical protein
MIDPERVGHHRAIEVGGRRLSMLVELKDHNTIGSPNRVATMAVAPEKAPMGAETRWADGR